MRQLDEVPKARKFRYSSTFLAHKIDAACARAFPLLFGGKFSS